MILPRAKWNPKTADPNDYHILWFDPGGTIGWAHLVISAVGFSRPELSALAYLKSWDCGEYSGPEYDCIRNATMKCRTLHFPNEYNQRIDVGTEDFELSQLIGGKNLLSPVRINAILEWELITHGLRLQYQKRGLRLQQTKERLNAFGFKAKWTTTGIGKDAFAAMQHAVTKLRSVKAESRTNPWKLSDGVGRYWNCACAESEACDLAHSH